MAQTASQAIDTARELGMSVPTVGKALDHLVANDIARELTGKRRDRLFAYSSYLALFDQGTEPLGS